MVDTEDNLLKNHRFTDEEFLVAGIGGFGLLLMIIGGLTLGFGTVDEDIAELFVFAGLILLILGTVLWLAIMRPWENYDDLKTAYYTGHDHDDHHDHKAVGDEHAVVVHEPTAIVTADEQVVVTDADTARGETETVEDLSPMQTEVAETVDTLESASAVTDAAEEVTETTDFAEEAIVEPIEEVVDTVTEMMTGEPDDLRVIDGIGPKTQEALYAEGITTYEQIANMDAAALEDIVRNKHNVRIRAGSTESWPAQARQLLDNR